MPALLILISLCAHVAGWCKPKLSALKSLQVILKTPGRCNRRRFPRVFRTNNNRKGGKSSTPPPPPPSHGENGADLIHGGAGSDTLSFSAEANTSESTQPQYRCLWYRCK